MRNRLLLAALVLLAALGSFVAKGLLSTPRGGNPVPARSAKRIVSMAPSITETLFALGLGDRVVGVTRFCKQPPEAQTRTKVGGFLDPNYEAILALKPDMVVMLRENERSQPPLRAPGFNRLVVSHQTIDGILKSVDTLGRAFGAEDKAQEMLADIRTRIRRVEEKTAGRDRPRVMVAIYRTAGRGRLEDVSVAGADGYFDRMIAMAGGRNACRESAVRFPIVASEGVLWMNPDVIIDIVPPRDEREINEQTMLADWQQVAEVAAVRNGRVHVLDDDFAYVPGPRFIVLVERLARVLHPEVDWRDGDPK